MSTVEYEAMNVLPPLKNSGAMKCIAVLTVSGSSQVTDLETLFGQLSDGHFLTLSADGPKVYVAFGSASGTIDPSATGGGTAVCFPIPSEGQLPVRPTAGREVATGVATNVKYNYLHYVGASGTAGGYLRVYRSSLGPGEDPGGQFKAP